MTSLIRLQQDHVSLTLTPEIGGGIASLTVAGRHVLRPWAHKIEEGPFTLANNILLPFSNRISNGIHWKDAHYPLSANVKGDEFPLHGDAFQKPWNVKSHTDTQIILELPNGAFGPFEYTATQTFTLSATKLHIDLELTNMSDKELPYGFGFHPWFPRSSETRLSFNAEKVGIQNARCLPETYETLHSDHHFDFKSLRSLPHDLINNDFTGWDGSATISQSDVHQSVEITASENLSTTIVYSPNDSVDFFCFEPVSHPVDAHNQPDLPGLVPLTPGQSVSCWMALDWS